MRPRIATSQKWQSRGVATVDAAWHRRKNNVRETRRRTPAFRCSFAWKRDGRWSCLFSRLKVFLDESVPGSDDDSRSELIEGAFEVAVHPEVTLLYQPNNILWEPFGREREEACRKWRTLSE
ncbi:hypothetical protein ANTQUA_LOCUS383 [Anthophora quadrimaculata]